MSSYPLSATRRRPAAGRPAPRLADTLSDATTDVKRVPAHFASPEPPPASQPSTPASQLPFAASTPTPLSWLAEADRYWAFLLWVVVIGIGLWPPLLYPLYLLFHPSWIGLARLGALYAFVAACLLCPLAEPPPAWGRSLCTYILTRTAAMLRFRAVYEDGGALVPGTPYVVACEPHSTLPMGMVLGLNTCTGTPPPGLAGVRILASSACFSVPLVRQVWWWNGMRPASRGTMQSLLAGSTPVALCPGGVREVGLLTPGGGTETLYLRARTGFVRLALQARAPLVPAFAFGQTAAFEWVRPPMPRAAHECLARAIGFMPLWVHDGRGLPFPRRDAGVTLVVGKPLPLPAFDGADPPPELVAATLDAYIAALTALFERHKAEQGCGGTRLVVM